MAFKDFKEKVQTFFGGDPGDDKLPADSEHADARSIPLTINPPKDEGDVGSKAS